MENVEELEKTFEFEYRLLSRLKMDCDYYLGNGNRCKKYLWTGDERTQIEKMKELYNKFPKELKPEWITLKEIEEYKNKMLEV